MNARTNRRDSTGSLATHLLRVLLLQGGEECLPDQLPLLIAPACSDEEHGGGDHNGHTASCGLRVRHLRSQSAWISLHAGQTTSKLEATGTHDQLPLPDRSTTDLTRNTCTDCWLRADDVLRGWTAVRYYRMLERLPCCHGRIATHRHIEQLARYQVLILSDPALPMTTRRLPQSQVLNHSRSWCSHMTK
jgi:hypothetical protein